MENKTNPIFSYTLFNTHGVLYGRTLNYDLTSVENIAEMVQAYVDHLKLRENALMLCFADHGLFWIKAVSASFESDSLEDAVSVSWNTEKLCAIRS